MQIVRDFGLYTKRVCTNVAYRTGLVRIALVGRGHEKSQHVGWLFGETKKKCLFGFYSLWLLGRFEFAPAQHKDSTCCSRS